MDSSIPTLYHRAAILVDVPINSGKVYKAPSFTLFLLSPKSKYRQSLPLISLRCSFKKLQWLPTNHRKKMSKFLCLVIWSSPHAVLLTSHTFPACFLWAALSLPSSSLYALFMLLSPLNFFFHFLSPIQVSQLK